MKFLSCNPKPLQRSSKRKSRLKFHVLEKKHCLKYACKSVVLNVSHFEDVLVVKSECTYRVCISVGGFI